MRAAVGAVIRRQSATTRPLLIHCTTKTPHISTPTRSFALASEVGHGTNANKIIDPSALYKRTPEQDRAALAQHEQMVRSTRRLLNLETLTSPALAQELRVVFHYWTGAKSHVVVDTSSDTTAVEKQQTALQYADSLLKWMLASDMEPDVLCSIFQTDECPSGALVNMMEQYLMPFRGTHQSLKTVADRRLRSHKNVAQLKTALSMPHDSWNNCKHCLTIHPFRH
jgi:hypothetical protein